LCAYRETHNHQQRKKHETLCETTMALLNTKSRAASIRVWSGRQGPSAT